MTLVLSIIVLLVAIAGGYLLFLHGKTRSIAREAERLVPPQGRFVDIDGARLHYIERGQGPAVLLVHGLGGHHHHMRPILEALDGYRVIALDRAGSGWSTRHAGTSGRLAVQASQIVALLDALGIDRALLVGHSLGGAVALRTALDHPERVAGLALLSPLTQHRDSIPPEFKALYIPSPLLRLLVSQTIAVPMSVKTAPQTLAFVFGPQQPPADYAVKGGAILGLRPSHFYATATDFVAIGEDMAGQPSRYGELSMPVGIIYGTEDRVLDHAVHGLGMEAAIPGLKVETLEGIGHMPQFAALDRVVAFVEAMAARAFPAAGAAPGRAAE